MGATERPPDEPETDAESESDESTGPTPTSHSSSTWKVLGETTDAAGTGVLGHNTSTSGGPRGVVGVADGTGSESHGVRGEVSGGSSKGVKGVNLSDPTNERIFGAKGGVYGQIDADFGYGVIGYNNNSSGSRAVGVLGQTDSPESAAIWGYHPDGVGVKTTGYQEVSNVTLSAYLGSSQSIASSSFVQVEFDSVVANHFPGSAFSTSTGAFVVPIAGTYHVSTGLGWASNLTDGDRIFCDIHVNGVRKAKNFRSVGGTISPNIQCTKTLVDLAEDDVITVETYQNSGSGKSLATGEAETFVTIDKIG